MQKIFHERYVVDKNGKKTDVIIDARQYLRILQLLEDAQLIKSIRQGEDEYRKKKIKPIRSLSELIK